MPPQECYFISYSYEDRIFATELVNHLNNYDIQSWDLNKEIKIGEPIIDKIDDLIKSSDRIIVIISENNVNSDLVQKALIHAIEKDLDSTKKILIPVVKEDVELPISFQKIEYIPLKYTSEKIAKAIYSMIKKRHKETNTPPQMLNSKEIAEAIAKEVEKLLRDETKNKKPIFIVHGHNREMKESVARLVENLGLEAIILHEKPDGGKTIIEKFETHSDVKFAIVLLSPDDKGCLIKDNFKNAKPRARQNVILELGYFIGKLRRKAVVTLFLEAPNFEMPSDILGILYIPYDEKGMWKYKLVDRLQKCGFLISKDDVK